MGVQKKIEWGHYSSLALLSLMLVSFIITTTSANSWWAVGITGCGKRERSVNDTCPACASFRQNNTITQLQEEKCREDHASFLGLSVGARQAIISCQKEFNNSHWNCSTLYGDHLFGAFVTDNHVRETGVLNAYFSAGAIAGISEDCHDQKIQNCPCNVEEIRRVDEEGNIIFESCRADYDFALSFLDGFVLGDNMPNDFGGRIDTHNINIGKTLMNETLESCHCHGVSGACTVQTCYKHLPAVSDISPVLFTKYGGAVRVNETTSGEIVNVNPLHDPPTEDNIIFSAPSPNFCVEDPALGTVGVEGRLCDPTPGKPDSCNVKCCGFGYHSVTKTVPVEECKFEWCCYIACKITEHIQVTEHFCNGPP